MPGTPAGIWCISGACSGAHLNSGSQSLKLKAKSRERLLSGFLHNEDINLFLLHQLGNSSGITLIPEFPISFPFPVKKSLYSLVFNHCPDHKIFSLWVGFTSLVQAGGNDKFSSKILQSKMWAPSKCWVCMISHTTCWERRQVDRLVD